jgi:Zinc finger C-x8-C-x5-C-x3-H type (and similar)
VDEYTAMFDYGRGFNNPRRFQNRGPKTYPCKYFHGIRGCSLGESCQFIHEEMYKGIRIPYQDMERVIAKQQALYNESIKIV